MTTRGVGGGRWFGEAVFDAKRNVPHLRRWYCFSIGSQRLRAGLTSVAPPALWLWRAQFIDCQRDGFSDMVQDSGIAERTRECKAEDFVCGCGGVGDGSFGRGEFAGAGIAGEFEPGIADLDGWRAWD